VPAYGVIGGQWGDEGKGKIIDVLASRADMVVRFSGGNNAGHTVINQQGEFKLHLVPAGIFWPNSWCAIGNGVVVDPGALLDELSALEERGVDISRLSISDRAHVVMPYHVLLDQLEEQARGGSAIGTTGKGIGPAYVDKTARAGIRIGDLLDEAYLAERLEAVLRHKNALLTKVYGVEPMAVDTLYQQSLEFGARLRYYVAPVEELVANALAEGKKVLLEGAQGALLDVDHGGYPYVTSSSSTIGGASTGVGVPPRHIQGVTGVFKAYSTRVGAGPMVSELFDDVADRIREKAWEYGTTTGRPRRCGWFDAVAARYSSNINGFTSAALTRLDVLDGFDSVKVCVGYEVDGKTIDYFPGSTAVVQRCKPVWEEFPGWTKPTEGATKLEALPTEAMKYVERLQKAIGCPIDLISTGPHRDETIEVRPIMA